MSSQNQLYIWITKINPVSIIHRSKINNQTQQFPNKELLARSKYSKKKVLKMKTSWNLLRKKAALGLGKVSRVEV
jgi:hypothetical protein